MCVCPIGNNDSAGRYNPVRGPWRYCRSEDSLLLQMARGRNWEGPGAEMPKPCDASMPSTWITQPAFYATKPFSLILLAGPICTLLEFLEQLCYPIFVILNINLASISACRSFGGPALDCCLLQQHDDQLRHCSSSRRGSVGEGGQLLIQAKSFFPSSHPQRFRSQPRTVDTSRLPDQPPLVPCKPLFDSA